MTASMAQVIFLCLELPHWSGDYTEASMKIVSMLQRADELKSILQGNKKMFTEAVALENELHVKLACIDVGRGGGGSDGGLIEDKVEAWGLGRPLVAESKRPLVMVFAVDDFDDEEYER
ncbi:hypothetical protein RJT34_13677 [Clitoria ternatea]|uniref:Uncharacterized protein n=1 Tax=Clitoria ternatea TaxID=43366 RepID=A0AAN9PLP1_CLITE